MNLKNKIEASIDLIKKGEKLALARFATMVQQ